MKRETIKRTTLWLLISFFMATQSFAQSSTGREFYVSFGKNGNSTADNVELILRFTGPAGAKISMNFTTTNSYVFVTIPAGGTYDYRIPAELTSLVYSAADFTSKRSILVKSDQPIHVIAINTAKNSAEATLVWPVEGWGTEYYHFALPAYDNTHCSGFILIAKENNTAITIEKINKTVTLQAGEVYHYFLTTADYIQGSRIYSNKPFAYIQNSSKVRQTIGSSFIGNMTFEQSAPTDQWGKQFIVPTSSAFKGTVTYELFSGYARIFAKEQSKVTVKYANGIASKSYTISAGGYQDIVVASALGTYTNTYNNGACHITSDKPVAVYAYPSKNSQASNDYPSEVWLPPVEQMTRNVLISPLSIKGTHFFMETEHYMQVIISTASKDKTTLKIDGDNPRTLGAESFTWVDNVADSGYSYGSYFLGSSNYGSTPVQSLNITALVDNPDGLIVLGYGVGSYSSYYYTAGLGMRDVLNPLFTITGKVKGLPNNDGITIYYTVDGGEQESITSGIGGEYIIKGIPQGANVVISASTQPGGYVGEVQMIPSIDNITLDVVDKDIIYMIPEINGFTINDKDYIDFEGKTYCDSPNFEFNAYGEKLESIVWKLNGMEIANSQNQKVINVNNLEDGIYTISMTSFSGTYSVEFAVGNFSFVWTPEANADGDKKNWNDRANWTPNFVPSSCNTVYIPGNSYYYPQLTDSTAAACDHIYFIQGAELGRPDLLEYNRAHVQYNLGMLQTPQITDKDDKALVLESESTADRMLYSASVSSKPLARERWYALSSPLRGVTSGDLCFGGFPMTFMKKFGPITKEGVTYPVGEWTTPYNSMKELFFPTVGFGFYAYGYGNTTGNNTGCTELGYFNTPLNDMSYFPERSGHTYGLQRTNGILELPFFTDSLQMNAHRTQVYNETSKESTFYYFHDGSANPFGTITGKTDIVIREDDNGNNRFIAEDLEFGKWKFQNPIYYPTSGLGDGDEFLAGNPYMSSIDMVEFCKDNPTSIDPEFRIWNGVTFNSYSVITSSNVVTPTVPGNSRYVSPLQGFFLTYRGGIVQFDVTKISTTRPSGTLSNLRSSMETKEENILRIKAENNRAVSYSVIAYQEGASNEFTTGRDVRKLFSPYNYVPEVYTLAGGTPADINYIDPAVETLVPVGIKTQQKGNITLTFTGMDNYKEASQIVLMDVLLNKEFDLSGQSSFAYTFNNNLDGAQNNRFFIRISSEVTSLPSFEQDKYIQIYSSLSNILVHTASFDPIRSIEVYDFQGRRLYEKAFAGVITYQIPDNFDTRNVIVRVKTNNQMKSQKILLNQ